MSTWCRIRVVLATVLALALVAGCSSGSKAKSGTPAVRIDAPATTTHGSGASGSSGGSGGGATGTTTTTAPGSPTTVIPPGRVSPVAGGTPQAAATKAAVVAGDLPVGFAPPDDVSDLRAAVLPCLGPGAAGQAQAAVPGTSFGANGPDHIVRVLSFTTVYPNDLTAAVMGNTVGSPPFGTCATTAVAKAAGIASPSGPALKPVANLPNAGDQSFWLRTTLSSPDPVDVGVERPVDLAVASIRTGRTVTVLVLSTIGGRTDQWMFTELSKSVADRQAAGK